MTDTATHLLDRARAEQPDEQPFEPSRCLGCHHRPADPAIGYLCATCEQRLPRLLDTIRDGYGRLDATPHGSGAGLDGSQGGGGTFESRPAARVDVLALTYAPTARRGHLAPVDTDERPHRLDKQADSPPAHAPDTSRARAGARPEQVPTVVALGRVADRCRADGLLPPLRGPRTVAGEALRLSSAELVQELPARWWVGEVLDELRAAAAAIDAALGEREPTVPLGPCPRTVMPPRLLGADGRLAPRVPERCGGPVRSRDRGDAAACSSCGHRWVGAASVHALAGAAGSAMLDLPALAAYLDGLGYGEQPAARMRKWAQLDGWARERVGARTLYRLGDVLVSARARRGLPTMTPTIAAAAS